MSTTLLIGSEASKLNVGLPLFSFITSNSCILNVDNTVKWWAAFHCGSTPQGYGLLRKAICSFENRIIKFDMEERGGGGSALLYNYL